jgi:hypothetical protein
MIYVYESKDGQQFEVVCSMKEAPPIGHVRTFGTVTARRVPGTFGIADNTTNGFVDVAACRNWGKKATKDGSGFAKRYNNKGQPMYESMAEHANAIAKANDHGEDVVAVKPRDYDINSNV